MLSLEQLYALRDLHHWEIAGHAFTLADHNLSNGLDGLNTDVAEIDATIDGAAAEGTWLVLTFHNLVGGTPGTSTEFNDDDFGEVVDHVRELQKEGRLQVRTVGGVVGSC